MTTEIDYTTAPSQDSVGDDGKDSAFHSVTPSRILIADDHEAVRRGLRSAVLGAGWLVCGEASNGREAVERSAELKPDLIVMDLSMPQMGGLEAAREILKSSPDVKIVVFTMHESQQIKSEAASIGIHAVAAKSAPLGNLLGTIRAVLNK